MTVKEPALREIILDILLEVLEKGKYSHVILSQALTKYQYLEKQDRSFIKRVVDGTVEYRIQLDYILNSYSKVKVNKMKPVIRTILRMLSLIHIWERLEESLRISLLLRPTIPVLRRHPIFWPILRPVFQGQRENS